MAGRRPTRSTVRRMSALVPLAVLSTAWTASLTTASPAASEAPTDAALPDGSSLPTQAIEAPASVSSGGVLDGSVPPAAGNAIIANSSVDGIPAAALAAYQRAAQVMASADAACNLDWTLLAAIGRVESNHGRFGGNVLDDQGVSRPGIYGIALDGSNGTAEIRDTDAGQYDNDLVYDRAVGPMQFIPSTWSVVGVDADGDGVRNPQDVDDAALAAAVYLCSGTEDLSTRAGQEAAVWRYNHSTDYVNLVLAIMNGYASGQYLAVPTSTAGTVTFVPDYGDAVVSDRTRGDRREQEQRTGDGDGRVGNNGSTTDPGDDTEPVGDDPVDGPTDDGGDDPVKEVEETVTDTVEETEQTAGEVVTALEEATAYCQSLSSAELTAIGGLDACVEAYLEGGEAAVQALLDSVTGLLD